MQMLLQWQEQIRRTQGTFGFVEEILKSLAVHERSSVSNPGSSGASAPLFYHRHPFFGGLHFQNALAQQGPPAKEMRFHAV